MTQEYRKIINQMPGGVKREYRKNAENVFGLLSSWRFYHEGEKKHEEAVMSYEC